MFESFDAVATIVMSCFKSSWYLDNLPRHKYKEKTDQKYKNYIYKNKKKKNNKQFYQKNYNKIIFEKSH